MRRFRTTPAVILAGSTSTGRTEEIRLAGIAALVEKHLGSLDVRSYRSHGDEPGAVDPAVGLGTPDRRDLFVVSVSHPVGPTPRSARPESVPMTRSRRRTSAG